MTIISACSEISWFHLITDRYHQIPNLNFDLKGYKMKLSEVNLTHKPLFLINLMSSCLLVQRKKVISSDHNGSNMSSHN